MGKLSLLKGQPAYFVDKSRKRKTSHESGHGENMTGSPEKGKQPRMSQFPVVPQNQANLSQPWKIPNYQALNYQPFNQPFVTTIPYTTTLPSIVDVTGIPSGSKQPGVSSTDPARPAKKAKVLGTPTLTSTGDNACPLCGGPKHQLRDCLVPKGGVEK